MSINMRRMLIGRPLPTSEAIHQRLSIPKALAVFSSDALSSTAYATEAILLVLIAAGSGALGVSMWIALGIAALLIIVAFSYFQTIHAYPNGGGAYIVSKDNLGKGPGLVAAAALLIDYILTVAVSVSAGVAALVSAFPEFDPLRIEVALVIVAFITIVNLRGVKESGTFFAIPTYAFIFGVFAMIIFGVARVVTGNVPTITPEALEGAGHATEVLGGLTVFLVLRAFAGGCTALTGVEAISNGIPAFKRPESDNAGRTLIIMVGILSTMFVGITFLANSFPVVVSHEPGTTTVISQVARFTFGEGTLFFFYFQFATLFILSLAANTAFADFPRLASLIAQDRFLPRQLTNLGDRLVFSNGILSLAFVASILIIIFDAREHNLLPLYAVGVFLSFTLSQSGMVVHWFKERRKQGFAPTLSWRLKVALNGFGAFCTFVVLWILLITKFIEGAWLVAVSIPVVIFLFLRVHKHYENVAHSLTLDGIESADIHPDSYKTGNKQPVVVLVNSLNRSSLQALEFAVRFSDNVRAVSISVEPSAVENLRARWKKLNVGIPLDVIDSPYREIGHPLIDYLHEIDEKSPDRNLPTTVILPEFVVSTWWEKLLHNQTSVAIREALYQDQIARGRGRAVINVPYRIGDDLYEPVIARKRAVVSAPTPEPVTTAPSVNGTHAN
ncbi:MAG: APC family permease [Anaerolineae bacterium]|nr:APC family permease [Anaerolineae bacterium]NUQ03407.1 APC family permease [Anaerolineae bacterium]